MLKPSPLRSESTGKQLIATYLGWEIFQVSGAESGGWLEWQHPHDQNQQRCLKYRQFIAPRQAIEEALQLAKDSINLCVELELTALLHE